jgi:iron complex transport system substrate-binding protein
VLCAACALTLACGQTAPPAGPAPPATREVVDDIGRHVQVAARPERIVSLAPSITEILYAIGAGDRIAANTSFCTFPPEAANTTKIGDTQRPDVERILALKPDLVLVSTASQLESISERLEALGVPTVVTTAKGVDGVLESIERIGLATGDAESAAALAAKLRQRIEAVKTAVAGRPAPKVFAIVGNEPLFTTGKGTFLDDLIRLAGGASITADETTEWPQYSAEAVIARAPDVMVVPSVTHGFAAQDSGVPPSIAATPAVRNNRIIRIDGDLLMRPGPRLVDGLEQLAWALHPEAFR